MKPDLQRPVGSTRTLLAFELSVIAPTILGLSFLLWRWLQEPRVLRLTGALLVWTVVIAGVELLPVPAWRGIHLSLGFPLLMTVGILYNPAAASLTALIGSWDPRELRREVSVARAVFNRCQVALSVLASSSVFHGLARIGKSPAWLLIGAAMLAAVADYLVNSTLVTFFTSIRVGVPVRRVMQELRIGRLSEFLISYLGLGILGLTVAEFYLRESFWSLPVFLAPTLFARQMFFRSQALEEAHKELQERELVLRQLSNTIAEERADERLQIAGYLHDDLAQVLFRLSIQVDVARKFLVKGDLPEVGSQLEKIRQSKQDTSDRIRALIRDLHRSPLGAKGLAESLESFTDEVGRESNVRFHRDVQDIDLPAPIALLVFHIAREGVMNALKHAQASDMWISVNEVGDQIELQLRDNGVGFDTTAPGPEGHFGMAMMRERAQVGGGTIQLESTPGAGTTITVRFPSALLQLEPTPAESAPEPGPAAGSQDQSGQPTKGASTTDGSRQSVRS
jgi:signal transduction histidine kinase